MNMELKLKTNQIQKSSMSRRMPLDALSGAFAGLTLAPIVMTVDKAIVKSTAFSTPLL